MAMLLLSVIWALTAWALPDAAGATSGIGEPVAQSNGGTYTVPDRVECGDGEGDLVPLYRAYSLITTEYVDVVTVSSLAAKAAEHVRDAGLAARTDVTPPACPLPSSEFEQVCEEIDAVEDTASAVWEAVSSDGLGTRFPILPLDQRPVRSGQGCIREYPDANRYGTGAYGWG